MHSNRFGFKIGQKCTRTTNLQNNEFLKLNSEKYFLKSTAQLCSFVQYERMTLPALKNEIQ